MKKLLKNILMVILVVFLFGCDLDKDKPVFDNISYEMKIGDILTLIPNDEIRNEDIEYIIENNEIISIENGVVTALKAGETAVEAKYKKRSSTLTFKVEKIKTELFECVEYYLFVDDLIILDPVNNINKSSITYKTENQDIVSINKGTVKALKAGEVSIETEYQDDTKRYTTTLTFYVSELSKIFETYYYEVEQGSLFTLEPIKGFDILEIEFKISDETIVSIENGVVTALKVGDTFVDASVSGGKSTILIVVTPFKIEVEDIEKNAELYAELQSKLEGFNKQIADSNSIIEEISIDIGGSLISETTKIKQDEVYHEKNISGTQMINVIKEIDGKIYQFKSDERQPNYLYLDYLGKKEEYEYEYSIPSISLTELNLERCNIAKVNNKYIIEAYYIDLIDEETSDFAYELYQSLGIPTDVLENMIVYLTFKEGVDSCWSFEIKSTIKMEDMTPNQISFSITFSISLEDFEKFDENSSEYIVEPPSSFEEIYQETNLMENGIKINGYDEQYIKVYLEEGQYLLIDYENCYGMDMHSLEIYDLEMNKIEHIPSDLYENSHGYLEHYYNTFYIEKEGYYYMFIDTGSSADYNFSLVKSEFETSTLEIIEDSPSQMIGKIEGYGDIDYYTYTNITDEKQIIKISNNSDNETFIACYNHGSNYPFMESILPNEYKYFLLEPGVNNYYIVHKGNYYSEFNQNNFIYEYDLSIEVLEYEYGIGKDLQNLESITTEFQDNYFMVGYTLDDSYMKLEATKEGYYKFIQDCLENDSAQVIVKNSSGEIIDSNSKNEFVLQPGTYIIQFTANDHILSITKVKYEYEEKNNTTVNIEVPEVDFKNGLYEYNQITQISNKKHSYDEEIKYYFELNEKSYILYDEEFVCIFDKNGKQLTIPYNGQSTAVIALDAGEYYFTTPEFYGYEKIHFCKLINFTCDNDYSVTNTIEVKENETFTFKMDWGWDQELVKIYVDSEVKVALKF